MMAMLCKLRSMVAMKMLLKAGLRELSIHTSKALDYHERIDLAIAAKIIVSQLK